MATDPIEAVYTFVERAYVRLQAGELLERCLEEQDTAPIQQWVEGLVLAGPQSLYILREIIAEVNFRRVQAGEDLGKVVSDFEVTMKDMGVLLDGKQNALSLRFLTPMRLLSLLREQGIIEESIRKECLRALRSARHSAAILVSQIHLLKGIEAYLQDWLWGVVYQFMRQDREGHFRIDPI